MIHGIGKCVTEIFIQITTGDSGQPVSVSLTAETTIHTTVFKKIAPQYHYNNPIIDFKLFFLYFIFNLLAISIYLNIRIIPLSLLSILPCGCSRPKQFSNLGIFPQETRTNILYIITLMYENP